MCSHLKFKYGALNQTMPAHPRPALPNCHMYKKERTGHAAALLVLICECYKLFGTGADRKVRFPYLLKINSNIYFQNQIHNMKA